MQNFTGYIEDLITLATNASDGPWEAALSTTWDNRVLDENNQTIARKMSRADAEFMAALNPQAVLVLLNHIGDLQRILADEDNSIQEAGWDAYTSGQGVDGVIDAVLAAVHDSYSNPHA